MNEEVFVCVSEVCVECGGVYTSVLYALSMHICMRTYVRSTCRVMGGARSVCVTTCAGIRVRVLCVENGVYIYGGVYMGGGLSVHGYV